MPSPPERSAFSIVKNSDLSTHRNEDAPDADGNSGQKSTSMHSARTPAQRFIADAKRLPPWEQLPARYDAAITGTPALLGFGLGVTFNRLLAYVHKRDIWDPWEPDHPIISPMVAWSMIVKPLKSKVLGLRLFYRTPYPSTI